MDIKQDSERIDLPSTGIYVRALSPEGKWLSADIATLERASLMTWLRSRGGENAWAEEVVARLLGHATANW